jgi:hypothetical protein
MDPRFKDIAESPDNLIFQVVFFPDRIYHEAYLNATRSQRYRYNAQEVRGYLDITVLKGEVYMDGLFLCNFIRLEYRGGRLVEQSPMAQSRRSPASRCTGTAGSKPIRPSSGRRWSRRRRAGTISQSST